MGAERKLQIGMIGVGWRAHGYMRVVRELGNRMEISGVYVRSQESADRMEKEFPGRVDQDLDAFMNRSHDFVMVLVPRECALFYLEKLLQNHIPVLMETPPGNGIEELKKCYELKQKYDGKVQVAEQYFLQPYHRAVMQAVSDGMLGIVSHMEIAMIHDYHGISIMRKVLGTGFQNCKIRGRQFDFPVQFHCGRDGMHAEEKLVSDFRKRADFVFENGKVGFFDFSEEQYFNYFRTRHMNVRGEKGEIYDTQMAVAGEDGVPVTGTLVRDDLGQYSNLEGYGLRGLGWNGKVLYHNPYWEEGARLSDDEIAMAGLLDGMCRYVHGGEEIYPLEEALQDTYLYLMMDEAIRSGREIETFSQVWSPSFGQE